MYGQGKLSQFKTFLLYCISSPDIARNHSFVHHFIFIFALNEHAKVGLQVWTETAKKKECMRSILYILYNLQPNSRCSIHQNKRVFLSFLFLFRFNHLIMRYVTEHRFYMFEWLLLFLYFLSICTFFLNVSTCFSDCLFCTFNFIFWQWKLSSRCLQTITF